MATFISLLNFTEQGIRTVTQTTKRFELFRETAEKAGITVKGAYWTLGTYDVIVILEGPEEVAAAALFSVYALGNVRGQSLRCYTAEDMTGILEKITTIT